VGFCQKSTIHQNTLYASVLIASEQMGEIAKKRRIQIFSPLLFQLSYRAVRSGRE